MKAPPKRAIVVAIAALLATLLVTHGYWQQPVLSFLGIATDGDRYLGYVEGETSLMAPPIAGQLLERPVDRGASGQEGRPAVRDRSDAGQGRGGARRSGAGRSQGAAREHADRQAAGGAGRDACPAPRDRGQPGDGRDRAEAPGRTAAARLHDAPGLRPGRIPGLAAARAARLARRPGARRRPRRAPVRDRRRRGADRTEPGQSRPGEETPRRSDAGRARGRAGREHLLQCRRMGAGGHARRVAAAGLAREAALLRARGGRVAGPHGSPGELHLRRLSGRSQGHHHLRLAARGVHAAGDLFAERADQAGLHDRGAARVGAGAGGAGARPAGQRGAFRRGRDP